MKGNEIMHIMGLAPFLAQSKCSVSGSHGNECPRFLPLGDLLQALHHCSSLSSRDWIRKEKLVLEKHDLHKHLHIKKTLFISQWNKSFEAKLYNPVAI